MAGRKPLPSFRLQWEQLLQATSCRTRFDYPFGLGLGHVGLLISTPNLSQASIAPAQLYYVPRVAHRQLDSWHDRRVRVAGWPTRGDQTRIQRGNGMESACGAKLFMVPKTKNE